MAEVVSGVLDRGTAASQPVVLEGRLVDPERAQIPVVRELHRIERVRLLVRLEPIVRVLPLLACNDVDAPVPLRRYGPRSYEVRVEPLVVRAVEIREIVHHKTGAAPICLELPVPVAAIL